VLTAGDLLAKLLRAFVATSLGAVLAVPTGSGAAERIRTLADLAQPQSRVRTVEVFHLDSSVETRAALRFDDLMKPGGSWTSYVRLGENDGSIGELYTSLERSVIWETPCSRPDLRWAVVLTFRDRTQQAFGFGMVLTCVEIMSTGESVQVSPGLYQYVIRTFPFMR
jgi:hypothetical protein